MKIYKVITNYKLEKTYRIIRIYRVIRKSETKKLRN